MKVTFLLSINFIFFGFSAIAQKISSDKVPANILSAFHSSFPEATKVNWIMEDHQNYEAEFKLHKHEQSIVYASNGEWIESEIEINKSELPEKIIQTLKNKFAGYKIEEASQIEDKTNGKGYEVEIEKGEETFEVRFSAVGEFINKKTEEKKKSDKD